VERDPVGNLLLRKPATPGMEQRQSVVLQAHLDMVPQKNSDTQHDFSKDPIQPYIDGEWVKARGTTLGADNGIGMASALAVLADDSLVHGPLEVLLTSTEEAGMDGAFGLQPGWLQSSILINTDSEQEGEVYMGCAGGIDVSMTLPLQREAIPAGYFVTRLTLKGLKGGHSGCDIHKGRGNANKLMARFLAGNATALQLRLLDFQGGNMRNAIPREVFTTFALPTSKVDELQQAVLHYEQTLKSELAAVEPTLSLQLESKACHGQAMTEQSQQTLIDLLNASPHGVVRMIDALPGTVESSLNLGIVSVEKTSANLCFLVRSTLESGKTAIVETLRSLGGLAGAEVVDSGSYPGWQPDVHSSVMQIVRDTYQRLFNKLPDIMVIHAGLECGLIKRPYPELDMVSIGPTIINPHSPDEKVHIDSVNQYWKLLTAVLREIPVKGK
ncbi:MAG: aminoacyl-histidine dipeptidase, partial [Enterobacteriaceae bacterium]